MVFPKQEYWSGLPFPSLGDLPNLGIKPASLALEADSLLLSHQGSLCFPVPLFFRLGSYGYMWIVAITLLASYLPPTSYDLIIPPPYSKPLEAPFILGYNAEVPS